MPQNTPWIPALLWKHDHNSSKQKARWTNLHSLAQLDTSSSKSAGFHFYCMLQTKFNFEIYFNVISKVGRETWSSNESSHPKCCFFLCSHSPEMWAHLSLQLHPSWFLSPAWPGHQLLAQPSPPRGLGARPSSPTAPGVPSLLHSPLSLGRELRAGLYLLWTAQQEMTVFPCCPPVATPQPGTLPRIPKFLYKDCLRLWLNLDCFLCSAVVAFTKTIGTSKWREHGFVSGSLILIWNLSGTQGLIFNGCSVM